MQAVSRLAAVLAVAIAAGAGVVWFLPRNVVFERSITVDASAETVFRYVNSMHASRPWAAWLDGDPGTQITFAGPETGVGSRMNWVSGHPALGSGFQEISASLPFARIESVLDLGPNEKGVAWIVLAEVETGTRVTWGFKTAARAIPVARWIGPKTEHWLASDYELGLVRLKELVDGG